MAFIRRVRTGSGATAVQIARYAGGRQEIVKHVGSAHTQAELGVLLEQARGLLAGLLEDPAQGVLDLGVDPVPRVETLGPAVTAAGRAQAGELDLGLGLPGPAVPPGSAPGSGRDSTGRVASTDSRLLFETVASVFTSLGFDVLGDNVFRDLVVARIVEPGSLLDAGRVLADLGQAPASYATMKRTLGRARTRQYRDQITAACFGHALTAGDVSLCLYDVTTLYFEAEKEDDLRKVGYSKERRVDPQIVVGLLVDRAGFPLEIGCFEGDTGETTTIIPVVKAFQERHNLADMVVVADAGMLSASNLKDLDDAHLRFIVGSRVTKAPLDLESHFRWHGDAFTDGQVIDTITPRDRRRSGSRGIENDPKMRAEPVWDPQEHPGSWRAVWAYSAKRAARDQRTLTLQENRALAVIAGEKSSKTPRFVKNSGGEKLLDQASLDRARKLAGLKGYVSNIPATTMPAAEVMSSYHELWHVEQSFRMSKTDLAARPIFHRTRDAIEAHLTIVFTALAVSREIQNRTGLAIRNVIRQLRPLRSATIAINGTQQTFPPAIPAEKQALISALRTSPGTHALTD